MDWIADSAAVVVAHPEIVAAALALGGLIVKATPTKTDDKWFQAAKGFFLKLMGGR